MLCVEHAQQLVFFDDQKRGRRNRCSRAHPDRLARHASLAKKIARAKHRDYRFLSGPIHHREFHPALLDVHDALRRLTLRVNRFASPKFRNCSCHSSGIQKGLRVKRAGLSIFLEFFWFHIQVEAPSPYGRSTAAPTLPRRFLPELYKKRQSTVLNKLYVDFVQYCTDGKSQELLYAGDRSWIVFLTVKPEVWSIAAAVHRSVERLVTG